MGAHTKTTTWVAIAYPASVHITTSLRWLGIIMALVEDLQAHCLNGLSSFNPKVKPCFTGI